MPVLLAAPVASLVAEVAARLGKGDKPFLHQPIDRAIRKAAIRLAGAGRSPGQQRKSFVDGLYRIDQKATIAHALADILSRQKLLRVHSRVRPPTPPCGPALPTD